MTYIWRIYNNILISTTCDSCVIVFCFNNCSYSVGAISDSCHVVSGIEVHFYLEVIGMEKVTEFKPKRDEYVKC